MPVDDDASDDEDEARTPRHDGTLASAAAPPTVSPALDALLRDGLSAGALGKNAHCGEP